MKKYSKTSIFLAFWGMFLITSCYHDDYYKISKEAQYHGVFLFPIGQMPVFQSDLFDTSGFPAVSFNKTVPLDLPRIDDYPQRVQTFILRIITTNFFPVEFSYQITFQDISGQLLFQAFKTEDTIRAAEVDKNGTVTQYRTRIIDVPVDSIQVGNIWHTRFVELSGTCNFNNADTSLYKYYKNLKLDIQLSARVTFGFNTATLK
ncbi:MAG: hypothetical protein Q8905_11535 [Bacteroidota bacterium]|nr:hypothetical protein [Bacteroidota bacterium]